MSNVLLGAVCCGENKSNWLLMTMRLLGEDGGEGGVEEEEEEAYFIYFTVKLYPVSCQSFGLIHSEL